MRTIAVIAILLLGISTALPEPEVGSAAQPSSLVKIESSIADGFRGAAAAVLPADTTEPTAAAKSGAAPLPTPALAASVPPQSLDNVCGTLVTSAQDNDLPIAFFANLIWQESRLRDKALSPKGAMGIAQFMPQVAAKSGVANPFDPSQALPASAKLLHQLFDQFGNLGYVAAAYNAGPGRVLDWLQHGRSLPRETRDYVMDITGRSIEAWRKKPQDGAGLQLTAQLPCRSLPTFAALEQGQEQAQQAQQAQGEHKQVEEARAQATPSQQQTSVQQRQPSARIRRQKRQRWRIMRSAHALPQPAIRESGSGRKRCAPPNTSRRASRAKQEPASVPCSANTGAPSLVVRL
jgi:Transglycosylase SLT domain